MGVLSWAPPAYVTSGGFKIHTAFIYVIICCAPSTSEGWLCRQQVWGYLHVPREVAWPPAVCTLPGEWFGRAKSRGIIAACFLPLVAVVGMDVG